MMNRLERYSGYNPSDVQTEKHMSADQSNPTSPSILKKSRREIAKDLWQDQDYRKKVVKALNERRNNPDFIEKMRQLSQGKPSPMEGKTHTDKTKEKIRAKVQKLWNARHGISEKSTPLEKKYVLLTEWIHLSNLLGHPPSYDEITGLKKKGSTRFSTTYYRKEFGQGSFSVARQVLLKIASVSKNAQEFMIWLESQSERLKTFAITTEDDTDRIKKAYDKIFSATSKEEFDQKLEQFELLMNRISRKITLTTPLNPPDHN